LVVLSTAIIPKLPYGTETELDIIGGGAESLRCNVAGIVIIPSLSTPLPSADLLQLSCGFALDSVLMLLIESLRGRLMGIGSGEEGGGEYFDFDVGGCWRWGYGSCGSVDAEWKLGGNDRVGG
jgi:hypothetical protein